MKKKRKVYIINAAGGNATAIMLLDVPLKRKEYSEIGEKMISDFNRFKVEQAGFLLMGSSHFEMSGGEFCGNAARAAALLLFRYGKEASFTMSGFNGLIKAELEESQDGPIIMCTFQNLNPQAQSTSNKKIKIVDLDGIVHIVISEKFPKDNYENIHKNLTADFNLKERSAVGVIWMNFVENKLKIDPVVWVKEINSFFYESSCGSGSIAAAVVSGYEEIHQPSGKIIEVSKNQSGISLKSEMEVIYEGKY